MQVYFSVFSSIPRKLYTIFQPTFFPIKRYQDILLMLLALSTDSVTKKITVIRAVYFYNSPLKFCDRICTLRKKLYEDILTLLGRENHHNQIFFINMQVQGHHPHQWAPFQVTALIADLTPDLQVLLSLGSTVVSFHSRQFFPVSFFHVSLLLLKTALW